ncbi:hypothetical protein ACFPRL_23915 [Pseudoclavibacter helvolus]
MCSPRGRGTFSVATPRPRRGLRRAGRAIRDLRGLDPDVSVLAGTAGDLGHDERVRECDRPGGRGRQAGVEHLHVAQGCVACVGGGDRGNGCGACGTLRDGLRDSRASCVDADVLLAEVGSSDVHGEVEFVGEA